jgi:hypothetical protein
VETALDLPDRRDDDQDQVIFAALVGLTALSQLLSSDAGAARSDALLSYLRRAFGLGRRQAVDQLGLVGSESGSAPGPGQGVDRVTELPAELVAAVQDLPRVVAEQVERSSRLFRTAETRDDLDMALAVAERAEHRATAVVVTQLHRAVTLGTEDAADELDDTSRLVWVPERDACLHCLELAGAVKSPGGTFSATQAFQPDGRRRWHAPENPPLHPHCRCQVLAWNGADGATVGGSLPEQLQREARRSVVKAWALPSESATARQRAAERLLARGAGLPVTVESDALAHVRSKRFKTRPAPP